MTSAMACFVSSCAVPVNTPRSGNGHWYCQAHRPATRVVHVSSQEFRDDPTAKYVGRRVNRARDPRCRVESPWANPYTIDEFGIDGALANYETLARTLIVSPAGQDKLMELDGFALGCWCVVKGDEPCHARILVKLISEILMARI